MDFNKIKLSKNPRIVTHRDTDGVMSAVLVYWLLKLRGKTADIVTTDYDELDASHKAKKKFYFTPDDIVVDLRQPDIDVLFWSDHHKNNMKYANPNYPYLFDHSAPSCAGLLYRNLVGKHRSIKKFLELINDTDMIDSADYPSIKYIKNIDNYGNKIRLGLGAGNKVHDTMFYQPALIREIANAGDWHTVLDNPLHMARVHTSIYRLKEYEEKAIKYFVKKGKVVFSDFGNKRLPGLINRYYNFETFPDVYYSLSAYIVRKSYRIVIALNTFNKDKSVKRLDLGKIARSINPDGGGHEGIGVIPSIKNSQKDKIIAHLLDLLNGKIK